VSQIISCTKVALPRSRRSDHADTVRLSFGVTEPSPSPQYYPSVHRAREGQTIWRTLATAHAELGAWVHRCNEFDIVKPGEMGGWTVAQKFCDRAVQYDRARHERAAREVAGKAGVILLDHETRLRLHPA
jgi:hypothetical protein